MAKGALGERVNLDLYGPQKGYDDPNRSLQVLAQGVNDVARGSGFKFMKLAGGIDGEHLRVTDQVTGSSFSAKIHYEDGERYAVAGIIRVGEKETLIIHSKIRFGHYRGGDTAKDFLQTMRGPIAKPEPIRGDNDLTVYEASKFIGVKESKISTLRSDPYGPPWYKDGHRIYFPREQLAEWKEQYLTSTE